MLSVSFQEFTMPYINVKLTAPVPRDAKQRIVEQFTKTLTKELGKKPEHIHIVIDEVPEQNWGFAGLLTDDYRKQHPPQQPS